MTEQELEDWRLARQQEGEQELVQELMMEEQQEEEEEDLGSVMKELFQDTSSPPPTPPSTPCSLTHVNWVSLLEPGTEVPPDVCFRWNAAPCHLFLLSFLLPAGSWRGRERKADSWLARCWLTGNSLQTFTVVFPRYFLAAASEVFRDMFFAGGEEEEAPRGKQEAPGGKQEVPRLLTLEVECSSVEAFRVMVEYLYGKFPTLRSSPEQVTT